MSNLPRDQKDREFFIRRALTDTGFFARHVLGMHTDLDSNGNPTSEVGKGGIRDWGPHQDMVRFFDTPSKQGKAFWAPRYSYKSSCVQAFIMRRIVAHPERSILLYMHDYEEAQERSAKMRDQMLENETIVEMFGSLKGTPWRKSAWTTSLRTNLTIQQRQLTVASPDKSKVGGRFNDIIFDDIVTDLSVKTEAGRRKGTQCVESSINLEARGTQFLLIGTPYHQGDANHWVKEAGWECLTHMDVGGELVSREDGILEWVGEPRWPNLSAEFLNQKLRNGMKFPTFMSQFMLKVSAGLTQAFNARDFHPIKWDSRHQDLTGYLLTDVAPSGSPKGDFNVLMYVGIDERNHVYILDLEVGYWKMHDFCRRYLDMLARWSGKVTHRAELWEDSPSLHSYLQYLNIQTRESGVRIQVEKVRRNQMEKSKDERIAHVALRFQAGEVHVMDTVPRMWSTGTETRELWHPEGAKDEARGTIMPSGDLVDWFTRFPHVDKKDVPDTFALVDSHDRITESPLCYWIRPSRRRLSEAVVRPTVNNPRRARRSQNGSASRFYDKCWGQRG